MSLLPTFDRVLVRRHPTESQSKTGLYIPPTAQEACPYADVIACGPGRVTDAGVRVSPVVEPGMVVLLGKWAGEKVRGTGNDEEMLLVRESEILAVVNAGTA